MASYDYLDQSLSASLLILPYDNDGFFSPGIGLTGFAFDGTHYTNGIQDAGPVFASWYVEAPGPYRSTTKAFPSQAIVILSQVALTIMDGTINFPPLWMQFILQDSAGLANNFSNQLIGFTPKFLTYSNGVLSVIAPPDAGSTIQSNMILTFDFVADQIFLYVAE
jgi:hypothetical protein